MDINVKHINLTNDNNNITKGIATICIDAVSYTHLTLPTT